jgi:hypothetical protein
MRIKTLLTSGDLRFRLADRLDALAAERARPWWRRLVRSVWNMTTVIPAQPGFFWLTAFLSDQAENDFVVSVPVVAWRVEEDEDGAHPVLPATANTLVKSADDRLWSALLLPDGQISEPILKGPWEQRFDNVDQWLAEARGYREWKAAKASSAQPVTAPEAANQRRRPWWRRLVG